MSSVSRACGKTESLEDTALSESTIQSRALLFIRRHVRHHKLIAFSVRHQTSIIFILANLVFLSLSPLFVSSSVLFFISRKQIKVNNEIKDQLESEMYDDKL